MCIRDSGYTFTTEKYAQFFSSKPWYSSRGTSMSDCESMFNDYERKNKETITAYESRKDVYKRQLYYRPLM